ncbi:MAG TPA: sialidase family protein [Solirubrobacteraceae bacterium]|nr:sialidase family protein [Solirubrobacteraceae bacterium]
MRTSRSCAAASAAILAVLLFALLAAGAFAADVRVDVGSPASPFPQNKQNEPTVAIDPMNPDLMIAGSNDEIDEPPCNANHCPFAQGIGNSGFYVSTDGGQTWQQPTYTGFSERSGTADPSGDIGTLPNYDSAGYVSDGDPAVAFGPVPGPDGRFSWDNGERGYYANLTSNFNTKRSDETLKGFEGIAVSHFDVANLADVISGTNSAWSPPALVSSGIQNGGTFSDKEAIWVDNAASSPGLGYAYVCWTDFRSNSAKAGAEPIVIARSIDGGNTWSAPVRLTKNAPNKGGRQGCDVRTDSHGNVYAFFEEQGFEKLAISTNYGTTFSTPQIVAAVTDIGQLGEDIAGDAVIDGAEGSRVDSFPHASIANGAPTGTDAPNTIALAYDSGPINEEQALVQLSTDGGQHWSDPVDARASGDRPVMPWIALSPDGSKLYMVYSADLDVFRHSVLTGDRTFQGVLRSAPVTDGALGSWTTEQRESGTGDGRASSANALVDEFIGDYNTVAATNDGAIAVYTSLAPASRCTAIEQFRQDLLDGVKGATPPAPGTDCPGTFGNTQIQALSAGTP